MILAFAAGLNAADPPLRITFIANEGFLFEEGPRKVLIDALWRYQEPTFGNPGPELLRRMQAGEQPFDGIQLLLVTHGDVDHFDAGLVAGFLQGNPQARLVAPAELVEEARKQPQMRGAESRAAGLRLALGETAERAAGGIRVRAIRLRHHPERETQTFAYLIHMGRRTILHMADSTFSDNADLIEKLTFPPVDAAFLEQFDTSAESAAILARKVKPAKIAPMHFYVERLEEQAAAFLKVYPGALVFRRPMEHVEISE